MQDFDSYGSGGGAGLGFMGVVWLAVMVLIIASWWKIFTKAGKPGWAAIVPIYNLIVILEIVGKPVWWFILLLVPIVNLFVLIYVLHLLSKSFGKDVGMTIVLVLFGFIGFPLLAFGDAKYVGPAGAN